MKAALGREIAFITWRSSTIIISELQPKKQMTLIQLQASFYGIFFTSNRKQGESILKNVLRN